MADREPRPSTDHEGAPLLRDPEAEADGRVQPPSTLSNRLNSVAQEPLTPLTKILLILALVLLLVSSVFIGLFAGAQHKLSLERDHIPNTVTRIYTTTEYQTLPGTAITSIITATRTATATTTKVLPTTTTIGGTVTTTVITTTTAKITKTTKPDPIPEPTGAPDKEVCMEPHCIVLSAAILSSLDTTQDPCENFYNFVNNGWLKAHPLPADKSSYGNFEALAQQNQQVIQKILNSEQSMDSLAEDSYDEETLKKLRDMYSSCLNEEQLNEIGSAPLEHIVSVVRKLFREENTDISSTQGKEKSKGLTAALAFLHSRGIGPLFSLDIEGDVGVDPNHMVLWFSQSDFGLPSKEYYEEKQIRKIYQSVIERLLTILDDANSEETQETLVDDIQGQAQTGFSIKAISSMWPPWPWPPWDGDGDGGDGDDDDKSPSPERPSYKKLAKKVVKFERELAQASLDLDILFQDPIATYNPAPLSSLTDALPQVHFPTYFAAFTPRNYPDRVIITYPAYAKALAKILDETSNDVIEAYLVARTALVMSPYLGMDTDAWQAQRVLVETLSGIKKGAVGDRGEYCVARVEGTLGFAAGRFFVNETFGGNSKVKGTNIITDIIKAFKASLSHIDWMDEESAKAAAEKADAIRVKVGYPISPDTTSSRSIAKYYSGVKIDEADFFNNILRARSSEIFKRWLLLGKSRDPEAWEMWPSMVNAYFNPPSNEIVFPAGILQPPFFSHDWPGYLSYGAFGQVASHELTHAFDSAGRLYNQHGKLEEWWTNSTSEGFKIQQDCIVKQFSEYTIDDGKGGKVHVNGNLTSGENIGDTGLIQAYRAWKSQYDDSMESGNEYLLPGVNYTREQLFFIAFGRIWARAMKPAAAVQRIRTDPHSPSRYRVDGTVSNIPEFAKVFKCSKNAKLNPPREKQCIFWS